MRLFRLPFAAALVILTVCTGLVVQSSSPAAAISIGPIVKAGLKKGGMIVGGVTLGARVSNPVGWVITAGQLAWWGYSERDGIMDFVHGPDTPVTMDEWVDSDTDYVPAPVGPQPAGGPAGGSSAVITSVSGRTAQIEVTCRLTGSFNCSNYYAGFAWGDQTDVAWCTTSSGSEIIRDNYSGVNPLSGVSTTSTLGSNGSFYVGAGASAPLVVARALNLCATGETLTGLVIVRKQGAQGYDIGWGKGQGRALPEGVVDFKGAKVTARCKNAVTGATTELVSEQVLEAGEVVLPSCKQRLGDDWYGTGITIAPTKPEIDNEPIPDEIEVPDFLPFDWDELIPDPTDDPDWQPCLGSKKGCTLDVWIDDKPCDETRPICKKWTTVKEMDPERVKCRYGSHVVDAKFCLPLKDFYQPNTETNTGLETEIPVTGDGDTSTGTGTTTKPTMKDPEGVEAQNRCFPSGWGLLNPVEWVYKPVKCVLTWAFVPTTGFSVRLERMAAMLNGRAPFSWFQSLTALPGSIPGAGCPDWRIKVGSVDRNIICGTGMGNAMRGARPVFTVLMVGAMFYPMIRSVLYAAFPLVKPTPVSTL